MANQQEETPKYTRPSYDTIDLSVVSYNETFMMNKGTLSQIVKSLEVMGEQKVDEEKSDYEKDIIQLVQSGCESVVEKYNSMVEEIDSEDYKLFGYFLNGYKNNGQQSGTKNKNEMKIYKYSNFRASLFCICNRLKFIKLGCLKKMNDITRDDKEQLQRLVDFCDEFFSFIKEQISNWNENVSSLREKHDIKIEEKDDAVNVVKKTKSSSKTNKEKKEKKEKKVEKNTSEKTKKMKKIKKSE
jgi:hypothetical protein